MNMTKKAATNGYNKKLREKKVIWNTKIFRVMWHLNLFYLHFTLNMYQVGIVYYVLTKTLTFCGKGISMFAGCMIISESNNNIKFLE